MACSVHEPRVHCFRMKNITFSADADLIEQARAVARSQHKTLNVAFREWLKQFARRRMTAKEFDTFMAGLKHVNAGRKFTRDEMNER